MEIQEEKNQLTEEEKELQNKKKNNIKVYSFYRVFAWDLLFYYVIIYLFLTIEKKLTPAQVLQFDAFYILFKFLSQIPSTLIIQKLGKRKSLILANFILAMHILIIMFAQDFAMLLVSQILCAFSFCVKGTCETDMLYDSLKRGEKRGTLFSKIDGKANSIYYYIDAITGVLATFLFVINPYIPMIICFLLCLIAFVIGLKFEEVHEKKGKMHIKEEIKNIRYSFKNIFKSKRLKSLVLFNSIFVAIIKILQNVRNTVLIEIGMPEQYFGTIFAVLGIIMAVSSRNQGKIHKKYKNNTLAFLAMPTAISMLILGVILHSNLDIKVVVFIVIMMFGIQYIMKGPYYILIRQYLNNFTNSDKRIKISTAKNLCENAIASILIFIASYILEYVPLDYSLIIISCIFIIIFVLLLDYMKDKVGLKPEEYNEDEIKIKN